MSDFDEWLQSNGEQRILLAQLTNRHDDFIDQVYIANGVYVSDHISTTGAATDIAYDPFILDIPEFSRSLNDNLLGRATLSYGELVVLNDGTLDDWLDYIWSGHAIKLLLGGSDWHIDDFELILDGIVGKEPFARGKNEIVFEISDKSEKLNTMLQTSSYSAGVSEGRLIPICMGLCLNVTPTLIDSATHQYQHHDNVVSNVSVIRASGLNVASYTTTNSNGTFKIATQPTGAVTSDLLGQNVGSNYPAESCAYIVKQYGGLVDADINTASITATDLVAPYSLGFYANKNINIIDVLDEFCSSVGAFWDFNRFGELVIDVLKAPVGNAVLELTPDDLVFNGLNPVREIAPKWKVTVGYQKNWTIQQDGLAGAVTEDNRARFSAEYSKTDAEDASILNLYPNAETLFIPTLLVNKVDAILEAYKWLSFFSVPRRVFEVEAFASPFKLKLGDEIRLDHPRFGWSGGKFAIVIGIRQRPTDNKVTLEVLR